MPASITLPAAIVSGGARATIWTAIAFFWSAAVASSYCWLSTAILFKYAMKMCTRRLKGTKRALGEGVRIHCAVVSSMLRRMSVAWVEPADVPTSVEYSEAWVWSPSQAVLKSSR